MMLPKSELDVWERVPLRAAGTIVTGSTPPTRDRSNYGNRFLFVSPADLGRSKGIATTEKMLSAAGFARSRRIPAGSTLFVCIGSTIGKVGIATRELTTNQQINSIIPRSGIDSDYLYYAATTLSATVREQAGEQAVPLVNKSQFSEFEILLPALPEQRRIANALSDADGLIVALERLIAKKQAIKQGMMQQLLTGRTRLPGFASPWKTGLTLNDLTHRFAGYWGRPLGDQEVPARIIRAGDVASNHRLTGYAVRSLSSAHFERAVCRPGDVVLTTSGTIGNVALIRSNDYVASNFIRVLRAKPDVSGLFIYYALQGERTRNAIASNTGVSAMPNLRTEFFNEPFLSVPELGEQEAISKVLMEVDAEIDALELRAAKARAIKTGMMQELLTGRTRLPVEEAAA